MQSLNNLLKTIFSGFKSNLKSVNLNIENTKASLEDTKADLKNTKASLESTKISLESTKISLESTKTSLENQIKAATDLKMDKNNPTCTGSFSLNRKSGSVIGDYSHAEGRETTASGYDSHAEGNNTTALAIASHAEGWYTTASGSHSHAEGYWTTASGDYSHAEGGSNTKASGNYSHAEGHSTTASANSSHAEGYNTEASSSNQHVQGKYNIKDSSNVYADIIGNGTESKRSNAATVDWSGNAWYAGDVYVGSASGTNKDEGSKKLATEEYVNNSVQGLDIPTTLPNPQRLTFTGAAEGTYDGSVSLIVNIPSAVTDEHINSLIDAKLEVIENGAY